MAIPLWVLEEFGTLDAAYPGRIDLGLGRSGARKRDAEATASSGAPPEKKEARRSRGRTH